MLVHFIDAKKKRCKYPIGFSFGYFCLGPIYLFLRKNFISSILLLLLYYWLLPIPGLIELCNVTHAASWVRSVVLLFNDGFLLWCGIFIVLAIHTLLSFNIERILINHLINRKGLLPASDKDAEILTKYIPKYSDLPVHPSYIKKITFAEVQQKDATRFNENLDKKYIHEQNLQNQLDFLYEEYMSGLISQKELMERQEKILKK